MAQLKFQMIKGDVFSLDAIVVVQAIVYHEDKYILVLLVGHRKNIYKKMIIFQVLGVGRKPLYHS